MRNILWVLTLLLFSLNSLSGCASFISESSNTLPVISQPEGATIEIINIDTGDSVLKAKTPYTA